MLLLDQIADDHVIEIIDRLPFDVLELVFFLLGFQCELDEELLQFFVAIVDVELFEGVLFEYLVWMRQRR